MSIIKNNNKKLSLISCHYNQTLTECSNTSNKILNHSKENNINDITKIKCNIRKEVINCKKGKNLEIILLFIQKMK